jgi:hypothetical protein
MRDSMIRSWLEPVQAEVEHLRQTAAAIGGSTIEERQRAFEQRASEIRGRARSIAARSNQLGRSTAAEMRALANAVDIPPGQPGFSCYDPTLAERLRQAAAQAEQPAEIKLREAVFSEGPAGVANAVKNLWTNIGTYARSLAIYITSGGNETFAHTESGEPITGQDLIALLATIGVDMGLLALAILNPPRQPPSIRPSGALIRQINDAIDMAVARAPNADREWIRRHFLHHNKASYLVIPNLYSCDPNDPDEASKALAMNQLAGVLSDLGLVRWPKRGRWWLFEKDELKRLKTEESLGSDTDLTEVRKAWLDKVGKPDQTSALNDDDLIRRATPLRNHGLFSKAERALQIAGWTERARSDIEIFRLVDTEGLTPLLMVLNAGAPATNEEKIG